jgi:hypothetical protein
METRKKLIMSERKQRTQKRVEVEVEKIGGELGCLEFDCGLVGFPLREIKGEAKWFRSLPKQRVFNVLDACVLAIGDDRAIPCNQGQSEPDCTLRTIGPQCGDSQPKGGQPRESTTDLANKKPSTIQDFCNVTSTLFNCSSRLEGPDPPLQAIIHHIGASFLCTSRFALNLDLKFKG